MNINHKDRTPYKMRTAQWMIDLANKYLIDIETVRGIVWQFSYLTSGTYRRKRVERFFDAYFADRDRKEEVYG